MEAEKRGIRSYLFLSFLSFIRRKQETETLYREKIEKLKVKHRLKCLKLRNKLRKIKAKQHTQQMRRRKVVLLFLLITEHSINRQINRRIWVFPRQCDLWSDIPLWTDSDWIKNIRMSRRTFEYICDEVRPVMEKQQSKFRIPIPIGKRVMIALWRLATNIEYRSLGLLFGIGKSTACQISMDFVKAVLRTLMPVYIRIPKENFQPVIDGFRNVWNFPQCGGAIDGTHIPIIAPPHHHKDYFNRKGWHSVVTQAVVDHEYKFMDIAVGYPGSNHDAYILRQSGIYMKGMSGTLFPDMTENINGVEMPIFLIGDPAYPLLPWLMKGFPRTNISQDHEIFNNRLSIARMVVENAFGRLKARWRCLLKRNDSKLENIIENICCCCTLHNICEVHREQFCDEWLNEVQNALNEQQPQPINIMENMRDRGNATNIRRALVQWVIDNPRQFN